MTGVWQPVPGYAILLAPDAQALQLHVAQYEHLPHRLVPSWGGFASLDDVAAYVAGPFLGLKPAIRTFLDFHLSVWLLAGFYVTYALAHQILELPFFSPSKLE